MRACRVETVLVFKCGARAVVRVRVYRGLHQVDLVVRLVNVNVVQAYRSGDTPEQRLRSSSLQIRRSSANVYVTN